MKDLIIRQLQYQAKPMAKILYVNSREKNCGVHQFGLNIYNLLDKDNITYIQADSQLDINLYKEGHDIILINYHPSLFPYLTPDYINSLRKDFKVGAFFHEVPFDGYDFYIHSGYVDGRENHYTIPRPFFKNDLEKRYNKNFIVGSFGFGFENKGWYKIIEHCKTYVPPQANLEFRFHIPFAKFGDENGVSARRIADNCKRLSDTYPIQVSHNLLEEVEILEFLNSNSINCFFYEEMYGRGIASTLDYALSVNAPIALTKSYMFRHLWHIDDIFINEGYRSVWDIYQDSTNLNDYKNSYQDVNLFRKEFKEVICRIIGC